MYYVSFLVCYLFHPLPRFLSVCLSWRESWGNRWKSIHREQTSYIPSVMSQKQINVLGWRYVLLLCDNGESIDNSLSRSEVKLSLCPGCTVFLQVERSKCSSHNCETSFVETVRISFIQAAYCHATCYVAPITGCTHGQQFTCQSYTSKPLLYASAIRYHFSFQTYFPWIKAENKCTTQFLVLWSNCEPKSIFQQIISGSITLALYKHRWQTFILASWQMKLGNDCG